MRHDVAQPQTIGEAQDETPPAAGRRRSQRPTRACCSRGRAYRTSRSSPPKRPRRPGHRCPSRLRRRHRPPRRHEWCLDRRGRSPRARWRVVHLATARREHAHDGQLARCRTTRLVVEMDMLPIGVRCCYRAAASRQRATVGVRAGGRRHGGRARGGKRVRLDIRSGVYVQFGDKSTSRGPAVSRRLLIPCRSTYQL